MRCRWVAFALLLLSVGCAHAPRTAESELPHYEHVFQKPLADALATTRALLEEKGYVFEDTEDPSQLVTRWNAPPSIGTANPTYARYLVTGIVLGPRQSVVRIFRMTQQATQNDVEWRRVWWRVLAERAEQTSNPFIKSAGMGPDTNLRRTSTEPEPDTDLLAALRGAQHGVRDLDLEKELTLRLESAPGVEVISGDAVAEKRPTAVRAPEFYLDRWQEEPLASGPCTVDIKGLPELVHPGLTLVIGEQLGSREAPEAVGHALCQAGQTGLVVVLGLSLPATEQARIDAYLASPGAPADQDTLLEGRFWTRPYQDGRSSRAILDLIDRARALRTAGQQVRVVAYDTDVLRGSERDAAQARVWKQRRAQKPDEVHLVLAGNTHTRTTQGTAWDRDFTPMAHLLGGDKSLVVLEMSYAQGTRWGCDLDRAGKVLCGIVGATPAPRVAAPAGLSPHIRRLEAPASEGYVGLFYVGQLTPSLPAILGQREAPPPSSLGNVAPPSANAPPMF